MTETGDVHLLIIGTVPPPFGGIQSHLGHAVRCWHELGYHVHVKSLHYGRDYAAFREEGIFVHQISLAFLLLGLPRFVLAHPLAFLEIVRQAHLAYRVTGRLQPFLRVILGTVLCYQVALRRKVDLVLAYMAWPPGLEAVLLKRLLGIKTAVTIFGEVGADAERMRRSGIIEQVCSQLRHADRLLAMSDYCACMLRYIGLDAQVTMIPYGVGLERFGSVQDAGVVRERHGLLPDRSMVLCVGRLQERLGFHVLVEAMPLILREVPHACIVLVGEDFGLRRVLEEQVRGLGLEGRVVFAGSVSFEELPLYYAACDVLVYPSIERWGCGALSALEAMASCKPVVASRAHGIPEIVLDGETGILVEPGDPAMLAEAVVGLLRDEERAAEMGHAGRRRAVRFFDEDEIARRLEERVIRPLVVGAGGEPAVVETGGGE